MNSLETYGGTAEWSDDDPTSREENDISNDESYEYYNDEPVYFEEEVIINEDFRFADYVVCCVDK